MSERAAVAGGAAVTSCRGCYFIAVLPDSFRARNKLRKQTKVLPITKTPGIFQWWQAEALASGTNGTLQVLSMRDDHKHQEQ